MPKTRNKCNVCGKIYPEGQGITLVVSDEVVTLHSRRCAVKFLKAIIDGLGPDVSREVVKKVKKEFEEIVSKQALKTSKKI
ncbi:MAG: hypothetical protein RMH77_01225 [Sulfolobales archaeon]|nr:hypothetical protein [Sulfolobales archaeon]MCX8186252.1 hypothetical protein [Sulfolobales archaeon]MDW7969012.1 hypothetical protein [Sulfolobales archaeon]